MNRNRVLLSMTLSVVSFSILLSFQNCSPVKFIASTEPEGPKLNCFYVDPITGLSQSCSLNTFIRVTVNTSSNVTATPDSSHLILVEKSKDITYKSSRLEIQSGMCPAKTTWTLPLEPWTLGSIAIGVGINNWTHKNTDNLVMNGCQWLLTVIGETTSGKYVESKLTINLIDSPINGVCGISDRTCAPGKLNTSIVADSTTHFRWVCDGLNSGSPSPTCSTLKPLTLVNGVCGTSDRTCAPGKLNTSIVADSTTHFRWVCDGLNSGSPSPTCSTLKPLTPVNGVCAAEPGGCLIGAQGPLNKGGYSFTWTCAAGNSMGKSADCTQERFCYNQTPIAIENCPIGTQFRKQNGVSGGPWTYGPGPNNQVLCWTPMFSDAYTPGSESRYDECEYRYASQCFNDSRKACEN